MLDVCCAHATSLKDGVVFDNGHNYIGHDYIGQNYIGHNYIGNNYIGNNYKGNNYIVYLQELAVSS